MLCSSPYLPEGRRGMHSAHRYILTLFPDCFYLPFEMFSAPLTLPVVVSISQGSWQKNEGSADICKTSDFWCLQWHFGALMPEEFARIEEWDVFFLFNNKTVI